MIYRHTCCTCQRVWGHEKCNWDKPTNGEMECWLCNPDYVFSQDGVYSFKSIPDYIFDPTEDEFTQWVRRVQAGLE